MLCPKGSVLIEVIVAIAILGVFLGGLAGTFQGSYGEAVRLRTDAADLATSMLGGREAEAWSWGPMIDVVEWDPGPLLRVVPGLGCDGDVEVAIWGDGWLVGEWTVTGSDLLELNASTWRSLIGSEVILRARRPEGFWGPPWRTVVPDGYGHLTDTEAEFGIESELATSFDEASVVVHRHGLSTSAVEKSWSESASTELVQDLLIALGTTGFGVCTVRSGGRSQSWIGHESRQLDVFW